MRSRSSVQSALLAAIVLSVRGRRANSRATLAKELSVSPSTIGLYIDHLIGSGFLTESGFEQGSMGRPKRTLEVRAEAGWFAGIEFNADRLRAVCVDFAGNKRSAKTTRLSPGIQSKGVINEIHRSLETLRTQIASPLLAVGIGAPGFVDPLGGVAQHYSFITDWVNVPLVRQIRDRWEVPVTLEHNLRVIALAERWFGDGRAPDDYVVLGPRSGFGIAIVKNGRLINGAHHAAGEIGHWAWPSADGQATEMHNVLSAPAIWKRLVPHDQRSRVPRDLYLAFKNLKDPPNDEWKKVITDYAMVIGYLQLLLDTRVYFLHGPLTGLGESFCLDISKRVIELMPALSGREFLLVPSSLGDDAGALGAASLAMENWSPT